MVNGVRTYARRVLACLSKAIKKRRQTCDGQLGGHSWHGSRIKVDLKVEYTLSLDYNAALFDLGMSSLFC